MRAMPWESLRGRFAIAGLFIFAGLLVLPAPLGAQQAGRWESAIQKFEQEDAKSPPAPSKSSLPSTMLSCAEPTVQPSMIAIITKAVANVFIGNSKMKTLI